MKSLYDIPSPAKINLFLHINGSRPDGYHILQTVFRFINLNDILGFEIRSDGIISCETSLSIEYKPENLIIRAARILQQVTRTHQGVHITLEKVIPQGGGLGGGSSNAASVLIVLNRLWKTNLSRNDLMKLALKLGADIPIFIFGTSAFAENIGEYLSTVILPKKYYLILQPDDNVITANIFSDKNLTRYSNYVKLKEFLDFSDSSFGRNDLEEIVYHRHPKIRKTAQWLIKYGIKNRMSGSGSCLYAEYTAIKDAILAKNKIIAAMHSNSNDIINPPPQFRLMQICSSLSEHPLRGWIIDKK